MWRRVESDGNVLVDAIIDQFLGSGIKERSELAASPALVILVNHDDLHLVGTRTHLRPMLIQHP